MVKFRIGLWTQSLLYLAGGINHFAHKGVYLRIMPDHYSHPGALIGFSGAAEVAGGLGLLVPGTRRTAAGGIALMLVVFFDVHVYMLRHPERFPEIPVWLLWARIPLQFLLIGWAWRYTRRERAIPVSVADNGETA